MDVLELLEDARKRIENPLNWAQGFYGELNGGYYCLIGAIIQRYDFFISVINQAAILVDQLIFEHTGMAAIAYNDTPGRKHSEILEIFDIAIQKEKDRRLKELLDSIPEAMIEAERGYSWFGPDPEPSKELVGVK